MTRRKRPIHDDEDDFFGERPARRSASTRRGRSSSGWMRKTFWFCVKWGLIAAVWAVLIGGGILAWYAKDLSEITRDPRFERRASITIKGNDGSTLMTYGDIKGANVDVKSLPPHLIEAVLATEDRRFYSHFGIDPIGLARAFATNLIRGGVVQGGSTITQQLAKNLFLSQERTFKRKVQEALLALWLEQELSKDEILSAYLNRVYMGSGAYGVEAASRVYFHKSAREVTLREAAMLAGLLKAPSRYSPLNNPGQANARADVVISAMVDAGYLTDKDTKKLLNLPPTPGRKPTGGGNVRYVADWVLDSLDDLIGTPDEDLIVETTLDPTIQAAAESALIRRVQSEGPTRKLSQGAVVVLAHDGALLAMVGGKDYGVSQFNRATQALRQPGSSFKPIVYLTALEQGMTPDSLVEDTPIQEGRYRPTNFDGKYYGTVTMDTALTMSLNTVAVRLIKQTGPGAVINTARKLGITADLTSDQSLALGSSGVSLLEMTSAYAAFANGGYAVQPFTIKKIKTLRGKVLYEKPEDAGLARVIAPGPLNDLRRMMSNVVASGTGVGAALPWPAAGKTGTSQSYRDAWFIGFTGQYIAGVWMGNDDNSPMKRVTGGSLPASTWKDIMIAAHNDSTPYQATFYGAEPPPAQGLDVGAPTGGTGSEGGFQSVLHGLLNGGASGSPGNHQDGGRYND